MAYEKAQFEQAFQLITAISHQVVKIDFEEMENWVDKIMGPKSLTDTNSKINMHNLKHVMRKYTEMQKTLLDHGIPVRNISNYREHAPESGTIDTSND